MYNLPLNKSIQREVHRSLLRIVEKLHEFIGHEKSAFDTFKSELDDYATRDHEKIDLLDKQSPGSLTANEVMGALRSDEQRAKIGWRQALALGPHGFNPQNIYEQEIYARYKQSSRLGFEAYVTLEEQDRSYLYQCILKCGRMILAQISIEDFESHGSNITLDYHDSHEDAINTFVAGFIDGMLMGIRPNIDDTHKPHQLSIQLPACTTDAPNVTAEPVMAKSFISSNLGKSHNRKPTYDDAANKLKNGEMSPDVFKWICQQHKVSKPTRSERNSFKRAMKIRGFVVEGRI